MLVLMSGCVFESFEEPEQLLLLPPDSGTSDMDASSNNTTPDAAMDAGSDMATPVDSGADMSDMSDEMDMGRDVGVDVGVDMGPDMPGCVPYETPTTNGTACVTTSEPLDNSFCDPVRQTGCPAGDICSRGVRFVNGVPAGFVYRCVAAKCEEVSAVEGGGCTSAEDCPQGLTCNLGICKRFCFIEDAFGCAPSQSCVKQSTDPTIGLCEDTCVGG